MSILCCDGCGAYIDTDYDTEAYVESLDKWLCPKCREDIEENED